ncbi:hypothetical protein ATL42_0971 [Sanguibacter antarcticus]|uniref:PH domain-containing protein n=1 Tax=Sanguibacter antarcticus TaxID=372484 RepID=A0A2A9E3G0_9MICO|nr:hypothetical protein ATL42_0971 [Sanguibacter antarcticus]
MSMPMPVAVGLWVALGVGILLVMWRGWRGSMARGAGAVGTLPVVPDGAGLGAARTDAIVGTYVSSTMAGDWLGRVVAHDLGVRSSATVQVFDAGVVIERRGAADVFVPAGVLRGVRRVAGMAGKYVGGEGIVVIEWSASSPDGAPVPLDTGIRTQRASDRSILVDAVGALTASAVVGPYVSPDSQFDSKEPQ